jgi:hypothetical protein
MPHRTIHSKQPTTWFSDPKPDHRVQFYQADNELGISLTEYISNGLNRAETCIVIARPSTLINLNKRLRAAGVNLPDVLVSGQYQVYDAEETLATFMRGGLPDHRAFMATVGKVMAMSIARGRPVRAFGEMVTVLLDRHNTHGLIRLEKYWQELIAKQDFSLYCAYSHHSFGSVRQRAALEGIHRHHIQTLDY